MLCSVEQSACLSRMVQVPRASRLRCEWFGTSETRVPQARLDDYDSAGAKPSCRIRDAFMTDPTEQALSETRSDFARLPLNYRRLHLRVDSCVVTAAIADRRSALAAPVGQYRFRKHHHTSSRCRFCEVSQSVTVRCHSSSQLCQSVRSGWVCQASSRFFDHEAITGGNYRCHAITGAMHFR